MSRVTRYFGYLLIYLSVITCSNDSESPTESDNYNPNGSWSAPNFVSDLFENKYNPCISGDGKTLYCDSYEGMAGYVIYYSTYNGSEWSQLVQFPISNYQQPCISFDGNKMYLSDDWNIYVSTKVGGNWSQPDSILVGRNPSITQDGNTIYYTKDYQLGYGIFYASFENNHWVEKGGITEVNSLGDVSDPGISGDGTLLLFTRSDGYGYKIYYSRKVNNIWQVPQVLGNEINFTTENYTACVSWNKMKMYYSTYGSAKSGIYAASWINN